MQIICTVDIRTRELSLEDVTISAFDHFVDDILFDVEPIDGFELETSTIKIAAVGPLGEPHDYEIDPSTVTVDEETGNINFVWSIPVGVTAMPLSSFKINDVKMITFAVCAEIVSGDNLVKAWHSNDGTIKVKAHLEPESGGGEDPSEEATNAQKIGQLRTDVTAIQAEIDGKADKTFVTPQMFGAAADGETDDAQAIKSAIDYAMANNCAVYFPSATYAINPQSIAINFVGGDSLVMYGDGKTSCIKRKDDSLTNKWDRLFLVNNSYATADSGVLYVHDLFIDSNRRNQSNATSDYTYEAAADFMTYCSNANGYSLDTAIFENLWFYDGVADHLDFTGTGVVHIKNIVINNVFTSGRQGTRNDIDFPGIPECNVFISNVVCQRMHCEYNGTPTAPVYYFMNNIKCEEFTFPARLGVFKVENLHVSKYMNFGCSGGIAFFTNCVFHTDASYGYSYLISSSGLSKITFENCGFYSHDVEPGGDFDSTYLYLRKYLNVSFKDCWFEYEGEYDYTTKTLLPINTLYLSDGVDAVDSNTISFDGCSFSEKFSYCAHLYGCGTVNMYNMSVSGERLLKVQTTHGLLKCTFGNVYVNGVDCFMINTIITGTCEFYGEIVCKPGSAKMYGSNTQFYRITGDCRVVQKITEPLTRTLLNSIQRTPNNYFTMWKVHVFEYIGDNKELYPEEWVWISNNTNSVPNSQFDSERRFKSIGSGLGDTASRPVCILSPGFQYYDTDLAKTIVWNGAAWTHIDGTALT